MTGDLLEKDHKMTSSLIDSTLSYQVYVKSGIMLGILRKNSGQYEQRKIVMQNQGKENLIDQQFSLV